VTAARGSPEASPTKLRSFLIADIRGYTRFTAEHGDAAAARLAGTFADLARDAVEARSGRVIELRGDEVLAVFDHAGQSVRAALELQATCAEEIARDPTLPLLAGIGLAAGEAVPVEDGFRGAALNLAARLCSKAGAGDVLVAQWVAELAGEIAGVSMVDRGTVELKGFPEPVAYLQASVKTVPPPVSEGAAPAGHRGVLPLDLDASLPLVGREPEMRWARGTWRQARRGAGRVVAVSGPTGMGKTRLAAEIAAHVEATGGAVRYAGAGGTAIADILGAIEAARAAAAPILVVLDDLDAAGDQAAGELTEAVGEIERRPALVLMLVARPDVTATLGKLMEDLDVRGDGHRALGPLSAEGVREICRVYAGDDVAEAPLESIARSSGGVPGNVHEAMSEWARDEATRRLAAAAEWLSAGRERHAAGLDFANNVIGLKLDRIYRVPEGSTAEEPLCPYKGLAPFVPDDSRFFFGREGIVGELAARTVGVGLLGVVGPSGSGKSSVVAAGLRSSLAAGLLPGSARWRQVAMRPGEHPMPALRSAVGGLAPGLDEDDPLGWAIDALKPEERLVVCVDQFEELFTTAADGDEAEAFVRALLTAAANPDRGVVVICLRGDFYGHVAAYPDLAEALAANHVLVGPMSPEELRRAIELPARRTGIRVESSLVDRLIQEVGEAPGGLPLLSTALVELWEEREGGWIRLEAYERTGGLRGAVARLAEQTFGELSEAERAATPGVFLRLVGPGEGEAVTRRRVPAEEFDSHRDPATAAVLERFTQDRLLSADDGTIEVAHEALLREWPRLRNWLEEDAQGRLLRLHLTQAAKQWQGSEEEDSELYRGPRLSAALDWVADHGTELNELERRFVSASREAGEREADRQRRTNRRLRGLLAGVAAFLVLALVAGSLALVQRGHARRSAEEASRSAARASRSATAAEAQRLGAQALTVTTPDQSLLFARESYNLDPSAATKGYLFAALLKAPAALAVVCPLPERLLVVSTSPDGTRLLVLNDARQLAVVDARTLSTLSTFAFPSGGFFSWAGSDRVLFSGGNQAGFYDAASGSFQPSPALPRTAAAVASDGNTLLTLPPSGARIGVFDLSASRLVRRIAAPRGRMFWDVLPQPGGAVVAVDYPACFPKCFPFRPRYEVWLHGVTGSPSVVIPGPPGVPTEIPVSVASHWFAIPCTGGSGDEVRLIDLATGRSRTVSTGLGGAVAVVALSPDGRTLVAAGGPHATVVAMSVPDGSSLDTFTGHQSQIHGIAFDAAGSTVYTAGADGRLIAWDLSGARRLARVARLPGLPSTAPGSPVGQRVATSADGRYVAVAQGDGTVAIVDGTSLQPLRTVRAASAGSTAQPLSVGFAPDGRWIAVGTDDGRVQVVDTTSWTVTERLTVPPLTTSALHGVVSVAFSPKGDVLAAGVADGRILRWSVPTWSTLPPIVAATPASKDDAPLSAIAFSPDGTHIAVAVAHTGAPSGSVAVLKAATGATEYTVRVGFQAAAAVFTLDGRTLITGDGDGLARFWNAATGAPEGAPILVDQGLVNSLAVDSTGQTLLAAGTDGATWLFDIPTRTQIGTPLGANPTVWTAAVFVGKGDGRPLALAVPQPGAPPAPATLTAWNYHSRYLAGRACDVARRNLTRLEWEQVLPNVPYAKVCPQYPLPASSVALPPTG